MVRDKNWRGLKLDNITVVMNAVDALAGDESFIELRKRRAHHRTLTTVERQTEIFRTRQLDQALQAGEAADKQLAEAQQRFAKEIQKIQADKSLDERTKMIRVRTAQENERRRLEVEKAEIDNKKNKEIREFKDQSERQIRKIESGIRWMAILFPPIPALLLGMYVFSKRVREERQGIVSDRMVPKRR
jgi:ABC-2 type transport system permease protein